VVRKILGQVKIAERFLARAGVLRLDLHSLLQEADPLAPLGERIEWLEALIGWVRIPTRPTKEAQGDLQIQSTRIRFLFMILDRNPELKVRVSKTMGSILLETESLLLFSQLGLSREHGFFAEAANRISRKFIPTPFNENDLAELFIKIFRDESDADWIESMDDATSAKLKELLFSDESTRRRARDNFTASIKNALIVLSSQISAIGLSPEIRSRSRVLQVQASAFFQLARQIALIGEPGFASDSRFFETLEGCRTEIRTALSHLDRYGVSVAIVYRLELLEQAIERSEKLARVMTAREEQSRGWKIIMADLIRSRFKSVELKSLIRDNLDMLARKIVERTGVSGEHYICRTRAEYQTMLMSASGGGLLTVFTTVFKSWTSAAQLPLFIEGLFSWINYSGSFLLMQGMHFTLATKQPSMTAPALAMKLRHLKRRTQLWEFVEEVTLLTRSQVAAAIGNVGMVIPGAILFEVFWRYCFGHPVLPMEYAQKTLASLHPFKSLTIPFAALTGVLLWVSSIAAGWIENWMVYRRIPEAIAQNHTLKRTFGPEASQKAAAWLTRNISGIGGSVALGFFLAYTSVFARFFGLPLDVRHVTLSTGALTFAVCSLGFREVDPSQVVMAGLGILIIGLLNFGVSFALALYTALRARHVRRTWLLSLGAILWGKFRYRPFEFFIPASESKKPR
jgi:site-specific recombinase